MEQPRSGWLGDPSRPPAHRTDLSRGLHALREALSHPRGVAERIRAARHAAPGIDVDPALGFRVFPPGRFPEALEMVEVMQRWRREVDVDALDFAKKRNLKSGLLDSASLDLDSPFVRLALRDDLVGAIARYQRLLPFVYAVDFWYSRYAEGDPIQSQRWHRDWEDLRLVKLFVFGTDVDETSGPLTVLSARASRRATRALRYTTNQRVRDEEMRRVVDDEEAVPLVGPAGTVALVDTARCFHFGSRVAAGSPGRLMGIVGYVTPLGFAQAVSGRSAPALAHLARATDPLERRLLLGAG